MNEEKILDVVDIRKHIAFILNKQFDTNINADNIWLDLRPKQMKYSYSFYIGIELGSRLPIKPILVSIDPVTITISYIKKNTKYGYEFNEVMNMLSYVNATEFSMWESE